jgi:putative oxidoreductase
LQFLVYQYIDIDIMSTLFRRIEMAMRQKEGKMITLWLLRIVVGLAFLAAGGSKLAGAPAMIAMFAKIGFGQWLRILTGLLEVTAAIGLFIPRYTLYAAATLAVVMASAVGFHLTILGGNPFPAIVLLLVTSLIAWLSKAPHGWKCSQPKSDIRLERPRQIRWRSIGG